MNGEPLPREHGFPVRMVVPGLYGFVSAGGTLGALTGPLITAGLVTTLGP